jgi:drug/metabolite transporter (DMT)-like permease
MQKLAALGVPGPALTLMAYGSVGLLALPLLWRQRRHWRKQPGQALLIAALGGWGAASFVMAMTEGDVVREMLLFYLAPAWSVLGARFILKEHLGMRRVAAVGIALAGAYLVIRAGGSGDFFGGSGGITRADFMALSSSITFAGNNLVTRAATGIPVASKAIFLMLGCATVSALMMVLYAMPLPALSGAAALGVAGFAVVWIVGGSTSTAYGTSHMEAGRAAIILLAELVAALVSASLIKGRVPSTLEMMGGSLILAAAAIDIWEAGSSQRESA